MSCAHMTVLLQGMLDGELDAVNAVRCEEHLETCPACAEEYRKQQELRVAIRRIPKTAAPEQLRLRIQRAIADEELPATRPQAAPVSTLRRRWRMTAAPTWWGAAFSVAALAASLVLFIVAPGDQTILQRELIAGHIRSLQAGHLTDVTTSDQHTVKPWFNSKLDIAPPVVDLASQGFPLVGGRLDYLDNHVAAALVYRHQKHVINLFVWPATNAGDGQAEPQLSSFQGYNLCHWRRSGMNFWAVSDLNAAGLEQFERAYTAETSS
jgi:anti-sigma factor (TIGR02949 family)